MYKLYTKKGCVQCERVKAFFEEQNKPYVEYVIGENITMSEFRELFPKVSVVPVITTDDGLRVTSVSEID